MSYERKYQHVERVEREECNGLLDGKVYIFPKVDGTNGVIWWDNGIQFGSRNRHLIDDQDNHGFKAALKNDERLIKFFADYPSAVVYGEWLVPHTLNTYNDDSWKKFYIFDIIDIVENQYSYINYDIYSKILDDYSLDYIPLLLTGKNLTIESLYKSLDKNTYLIKDGQGVGEGVVIKNYNFVNKFGNTIWGKIVRNDFKEQNKKAFGVNHIIQKNTIEQNAVDIYLTEEMIRKTASKIGESLTAKDIPRLLSTVYHDFVIEEVWQIIKKFKNPIINYKNLQRFVTIKTKLVLKELF